MARSNNGCVDACSIHVASVVQMTHMLICHAGILKSGALTRMQQLASYWAATVHDYEHGGVNNDFLIKTAHPLAIMYNDSSPLENHHLAASSRVLYKPEYCFPPVCMLCCAELPPSWHAVLLPLCPVLASCMLPQSHHPLLNRSRVEMLLLSHRYHGMVYFLLCMPAAMVCSTA